MAEISLAAQTMFADLLQRCLDAEFDEEFDSAGYFKRRKRGNRYYWYFRSEGRNKRERYVGPVTDKSITDRIKRFETLKSDFRDRQALVRALISAGLPAPDTLSGQIIEAMWQAGFFRLRGVLVGTIAFQAYAGLLGLNLRTKAVHTQDVDFAQFWGISENIGESMPPIREILAKVDESFQPMPTVDDPFVSSRYRNASGYCVDVLTPNRGSDEHQSRPARMRAPANSPAQPLRHLDYCIHEPERSLLLHGGGVPVLVPRAERFAIHKLIVAVERREQVKSAKDILQSETLIPALAKQRPHELAEALTTAWDAGPKWRDKLERGFARLDDGSRAALINTFERWRSTRRGRQWSPEVELNLAA
ncbi:MAG: GSU2403 family nucleotidyltransferase fold protein, partial [Dichotomicrobium sp.]